jgi:preprotein translocase subunit YajC
VSFLVFLLFAFVLMWLLVVLPQRRRQAAQKAMLESIEPGMEVLTAGGLYGDVVEVGEDELAIEIAPGVVVRIATRSVATVIPPDAYEHEDDDVVDVEEEDAELAPAEEIAEALPEAEAERARSEADRR